MICLMHPDEVKAGRAVGALSNWHSMLLANQLIAGSRLDSFERPACWQVA